MVSWLIKVGDKFNFEGDEWTVINVSEFDDTLIARTKDDDDDYVFFQNTVYQFFYEQQKQRADRAEKRWEKLKEHFNKEKEQSFGILSWSRNNGMLELMEKLEEDGE